VWLAAAIKAQRPGQDDRQLFHRIRRACLVSIALIAVLSAYALAASKVRCGLRGYCRRDEPGPGGGGALHDAAWPWQPWIVGVVVSLYNLLIPLLFWWGAARITRLTLPRLAAVMCPCGCCCCQHCGQTASGRPPGVMELAVSVGNPLQLQQGSRSDTDGESRYGPKPKLGGSTSTPGAYSSTKRPPAPTDDANPPALDDRVGAPIVRLTKQITVIEACTIVLITAYGALIYLKPDPNIGVLSRLLVLVSAAALVWRMRPSPYSPPWWVQVCWMLSLMGNLACLAYIHKPTAEAYEHFCARLGCA
jgi:hypothetical protein